jgi:hypothetical protein
MASPGDSSSLSRNGKDNTPQKSPFSKRLFTSSGKGSASKRPKRLSKFRIIRVNAEDFEVNGFLIYTDGYIEKVMTDPLFTRHDPGNKEYLETIGCVPHCFNLLPDGAGPTHSRANLRKNKEEYPFKALAVVSGVDTSDGSIRLWFNGTFVPALCQLESVTNPNAIPSLSAEPFEIKVTWGDIVPRDDWLWVAKTHCIFTRPEPERISVAQYFQSATDAIYSFHRKGTLMEHFIRTYKICADHVRTPDVAEVTRVNALMDAERANYYDD